MTRSARPSRTIAHRLFRAVTAPLMALVLAVTVPIGNSISENRASLTWWQAWKDWVTG